MSIFISSIMCPILPSLAYLFISKKLSLTQLNSLIDKLLPEVTTNITQTEILSYASKIAQYNVTDSFGWPYEVRGYTGAAWYAAPVTLEENVRKLHEQLFENEE